MTANNVAADCICGESGMLLDADVARSSVGACHCDTCRRWGGGAFMSIQVESGVSLKSVENIGIYQSSAWAERGFCKQCGTHLFYRISDGGPYFIPAGLFDEAVLSLDHQVFIDEKPDYYSFSQVTPCMTGAEVFAQFSSDE